jgi:hypothetical protein
LTWKSLDGRRGGYRPDLQDLKMGPAQRYFGQPKPQQISPSHAYEKISGNSTRLGAALMHGLKSATGRLRSYAKPDEMYYGEAEPLSEVD